MKKSLILFIIIYTNCFPTHSASLKAAVVEYSPLKREDAEDTIKVNVDGYRRILENLHDNEVDIIVFPEYGLTGPVKNFSKYALVVPDDFGNSVVLQELSDMAMEHSITLVINLIEKSAGQNLYYNTNLVIAKNGTLIAKYRKMNLNKATESGFAAGTQMEMFELNGSKLCVMINEDILSPNVTNYLTNKNVDIVAVSMSWRNKIPFEVATSVQSGFSIRNNVIVLAANLNDPIRGISGSGIYGNFTESFTTGQNSTKIIAVNLHEQLPLDIDISRGLPGEDPLKDLTLPMNFLDYLKGDYKSESNNDVDVAYILLEPEMQTLDNRNFNCKSTINRTDNSEVDIYMRTLAFKTTTNIMGINQKVRGCMFMMCKNDTFPSCGERYEVDKFNINDIKIKADLNSTNSMPISWDYNLKSINDVSWFINETDKFITMTSENDGNQSIVVFGIIEYTPYTTETSHGCQVSINFSFIIFLGLIGLLVSSALVT